jgi:sugar-specific transcriptional regulator TrmB
MFNIELQELGLTKNESIVYETLLELGETKTGPIVKLTGMHRVLIYDALEQLIKKGLASWVIKENIKYFQAAEPSSLISFLDEKKDLASRIIPKLNAKKNQEQTSQKVTVFEGMRGLKTAMNAMLKEIPDAGEHRVFASGHMAPTMGPYYLLFQQKKKEKHIKTKVIYDKTFQNNKEIIKATYGTISFTQMGPFPTDTWIYNDKVLIVTYTATPPIAILIQSEQTTISYKKVFDSIWKQVRK